MKSLLLSGIASVAILAGVAGCAALQQYEPAANASLVAFEAVNGDILQIEQQVSANGAQLTPEELVAFEAAEAAVNNAIVAVTSDQSKAATEFAAVTTALNGLVPFVPDIAAVIAALSQPAPAPSALIAAVPATAPSAAVAQLGRDLQAAKKAAS